MKLSHLRDVMVVAEFGSLRAAGRHLGIAQPAITRAIREIEQELGVTLFERHAKGVKLTTMGQAFLRRAEAVQSELRRAREEIEQLKGRGTGQVSIAVSPAVSIAVMPPAIGYFRKRYPEALLRVSENLFQPVETDILDGKIDFYVGPLDPTITSTQLAVEKLFDNQRVVIARKGHALIGADAATVLKEGQWIRPSLSIRNSEADFDEWFESQGLPRPQIVMHCPSALVALSMVVNSDLLTIMPQQWLEFAPTGERVEALRKIAPMPAAPICIVRRHDFPLTPMAEHLCDLMRKVGTNYAHRRKPTKVA